MTDRENIINEAKLLIISISNDYITAKMQPESDCFSPDEYKKNWLGATKQKMLGVVNLAEVLLHDESCVYPVFVKCCETMDKA